MESTIELCLHFCQKSIGYSVILFLDFLFCCIFLCVYVFAIDISFFFSFSLPWILLFSLLHSFRKIWSTVARRKHRDYHQKMTSFKVSICHSYLLLGNKLPQIWCLSVSEGQESGSGLAGSSGSGSLVRLPPSCLSGLYSSWGLAREDLLPRSLMWRSAGLQRPASKMTHILAGML